MCAATWDTGIVNRSLADLTAAVETIRSSPTDAGSLEMIVRRPGEDQREVLERGELDEAVGLVGDNWVDRSSARTDDGGPHPDMQLNIMNVRAIAAIAGDRERWQLAGDQLYVDLDLSEANLPPGTRLQIGEAVIEVTSEPHTGCQKFSRRFGVDALRFVNSAVGRELKARGINARVVVAGEVSRGDTVTKIASSS
jgi:MOSC domain-containing protein YiiM